MAKVYYKRMVEGMTVPAVIHNSGYYYTTMPVYEDGSMDCWERISLSGLKQKLDRSWLVTEIPAGKSISIHGLGSYKILDAKWEYTEEGFLAHIRDCVKSMNANMAGLFEETAEQKKRFEESRRGWTAKGTPYKLTGNFGYNMQNGDSTNILYKVEAGWLVTSVTAYKDETLSVDAIPDRFFTMNEIRELFVSGKLSSDPKGTVTLLMPGLGTVTGEAEYNTKSKEKLKEIEDMAAKICGKPGLHERCRKLYVEYLEWPCDENRERLREAYEAVPEHERMYLGDMDSKDGDYRRILYSDRKREV